MVANRFWYLVALAVTGLGSLGLQAWVWLEGGMSWYHRGGHGLSGHGGWFLAGLFSLALVALGAVWSLRRREPRIDALGDLATEYVEGRISREEYRARHAVLKESL